MKQMQIYVSMPSFNISEQRLAQNKSSAGCCLCVYVCFWVPAGACILAFVCVYECVFMSVCSLLALGCVSV